MSRPVLNLNPKNGSENYLGTLPEEEKANLSGDAWKAYNAHWLPNQGKECGV
ncbi:hypothetical protein [Dyadobacter jiangsuensis]|uniref:Uncharacterized protein n=1 Tax=Dyadobacter jiangsuensis TaxID=1591085 RepID=A0A2P8G0H4_9BACT|nr:hypothetical protein [Dyadobacter jiangsuensis]PSL27466.1 hypothetical protein CLV60_108324 [Dyadobacter jiangsuensis]